MVVLSVIQVQHVDVCMVVLSVIQVQHVAVQV